MNRLPTTSIATRLNALAAAAVVTLSLMLGIDSLALARSAAAPMAQAAATQAA